MPPEPFRRTRCNPAVEGRPLIERARNGDARAFEELVAMHTQIAFRTAYLITGSAADAEEAAQDGFVKAWRALRRFRPGAEFRPWLLKIVANEARNRRRAAFPSDAWRSIAWTRLAIWLITAAA